MSIASTIVRHAPSILKGVAVAGVGATVFTAHRDAKRAYRIIDEAEFKRVDKKQPALTVKEKALLTWKCYIPTAGVVCATGLAIFGLHRIRLNQVNKHLGMVLNNLEVLHYQLRSEAGREIIGTPEFQNKVADITIATGSRVLDLSTPEGFAKCVGLVQGKADKFARRRTFLSPIFSVVSLAATIASATFNLQNKKDALGVKSVRELTPAEIINEFALDTVSVLWGLGSSLLGIRKIETLASDLLVLLYEQGAQSLDAYESVEKLVRSKFGPEKLDDMRDEIRSNAQKNTPEGNTIVLAGDDVTIMDEHSGRVFQNNVLDIREAVNETNAEALNNVYASLTDFWDRIGLDPTSSSDELGWSADRLLEVSFEPIVLEGKRPALLLQYDARPFGRLSEVRG